MLSVAIPASLDTEAICRAVLAVMPDTWAIYLHGSVVTGEARADSDLDIALLPAPGQTIPDVLTLSAVLSRIAGREVDIANLRRAGNVLRKEVLTHGVRIHAANTEQTLAWEAGALSEYAEHQQRIRTLLDDFNHSGVGYRT